MLYGCINWQIWDIFCPWLTFLLVEESTGLCLRLSESRQSFSSEFSTLLDSLVQGLPSFQGFPAFFIKPRVWFLGNGGCPWDAVIFGLDYVFDKECKGSPSSRMSSVILSKHRSWNSSQSALENTQWEGSQLGWVSATDVRIEVSMG